MKSPKKGMPAAIGAAGIMALALSGCTSIDEGSAADNCDLIRIGTGPAAYGPYLPLYVAESEGFFEDRGITAEITEYGGGGPAAEGLAAGEADLISWTPLGLAAGQARGLDQIIVSAGMTNLSGWYVLVPEDSPVESLQDLDNVQVGIGGSGGPGEHYALWAEAQSGGDWDLIDLGYGPLNQGLTDGTVEAIMHLPPHSYALPVDGEAKVVAHLAEEMEPTLGDTWVASTDYHESCSETVQASVDAMSEGVEKLQSDKEFALEKIEEYLDVTGEVAELEYENTVMSLSPDGGFEHEWVENALELARTIGLDDDIDLPDADELYTDSYVPVD